MSYLQVNIKNHFKALFSLIITTVLLTGVWAWFKFDKDFGIIFLIGWLFDALPAFYLHLEYYIKNNNQEIEIRHDGIQIKNKSGELFFFRADELEMITVYKSASLDRGGMPILAMESYHFARIITKSGYEIIITSLIAPRVEDAIKELKEVGYNRKKSFFCTIAWR